MQLTVAALDQQRATHRLSKDGAITNWIFRNAVAVTNA